MADAVELEYSWWLETSQSQPQLIRLGNNSRSTHSSRIRMEHVIVFTKYPHPGFAKTRLIPRLGANGAAKVSRALSERCVSAVREYLQSAAKESLRIYYAGRTTKKAMLEWLGDGEYFEQCEGDLGIRMLTALKQSFDDGAVRAVVVGTDIPELDMNILRDAFDKLKERDVVVGPAVDGGYYLIGMKKTHDMLFREVEWSTNSVLQVTKQRAKELDIGLVELKTLRDVDLPNDVSYLRNFVDVPADVERV